MWVLQRGESHDYGEMRERTERDREKATHRGLHKNTFTKILSGKLRGVDSPKFL